jgi:hypothetical protein
MDVWEFFQGKTTGKPLEMGRPVGLHIHPSAETVERQALRDYFAGHAPEMPAWWVRNYPITDDSMEIFVAWRWYYADAMLAERERKTNAD